jgi:hypothetical protein
MEFFLRSNKIKLLARLLYSIVILNSIVILSEVSRTANEVEGPLV